MLVHPVLPAWSRLWTVDVTGSPPRPRFSRCWWPYLLAPPSPPGGGPGGLLLTRTLTVRPLTPLDLALFGPGISPFLSRLRLQVSGRAGRVDRLTGRDLGA